MNWKPIDVTWLLLHHTKWINESSTSNFGRQNNTRVLWTNLFVKAWSDSLCLSDVWLYEVRIPDQSVVSVQEAGLCAAQTAEHQTQQDVVQQWHNVPSTAQRLSYYAQAGCSAKEKGFSTPKLYAKRALLNLKPSVYGETVRDADSHFRWCHSQTQYKKFCYVALWWHETTQEDCIGKEKQLSHKHPPQRRLQKRPFELNQHLLQPNVSFEMCFLCLHSRHLVHFV